MHDWDYVPLSDARVVAELIRHRVKSDAAYSMQLYAGAPYNTSGGHVFKEGV